MAKPDVLRSSSFHASFVGLLKLDYEYTGVDGGIDDETALGFPVRAVTVRGLTFERAQAGELTPGLEAAFKEAVLALQKGGGLIGIAGNCGFMMFYQQLVRRLASVPCFMSPLMQAPLISGALPPTGKILLLTANKSSLLAARKVLLTEAAVRVDDPEQFLIEGLDDLDGFETVANPELGKMDQPKVEAGILERVRKIIATTPIRAVLSECTELPAFSDALRCATSLPVYDVVTCLNFFSAASMPSFAATMLKQQQLHQAAAAAAKQEALVLPPVRNEERALREDARKLTRTQLEMAMDAMHFLERELLIDPLEAEVNDVTGSNVAATVWSRLETLSRAVPMLKGSTTTDTLNEVCTPSARASAPSSAPPCASSPHSTRTPSAGARRIAQHRLGSPAGWKLPLLKQLMTRASGPRTQPRPPPPSLPALRAPAPREPPLTAPFSSFRPTCGSRTCPSPSRCTRSGAPTPRRSARRARRRPSSSGSTRRPAAESRRWCSCSACCSAPPPPTTARATRRARSSWRMYRATTCT